MDAKIARTDDPRSVCFAPAECMRRNLYVKPVKPERWEAISAIASQQFSTRDEALEWARYTAKREWEMSGVPWGVKVWGVQGGWVYDAKFGDAADDPNGVA